MAIDYENDEHYKNFNSWYVDSLVKMYPDRNSGFPILMIIFPILERYLRHKNGLNHKDNLNNGCMDELIRIFPELSEPGRAWKFWNVYRNGILHQVTLSQENRAGTTMPVGWLSHDHTVPVLIDSNGNFWIHPVLFSQHILEIVKNNFGIFKMISVESTPLPKVKERPMPIRTNESSDGRIILGTSSEIY